METQYYYLPVISGLVTMLMSKVYHSDSIFDQLPLEMEEGQALVVVSLYKDKTIVQEVMKSGKGHWVTDTGMVLTLVPDVDATEAIEIFAAALDTATNIGKGGC